MAQSEYRLDMSVMLAVHDALRRDLIRVARIADKIDESPGRLLHAAQGWGLFKKFLVAHHAAEDLALWPALRAHVAGQPNRSALVDAMEAEHAALDPLLASIDLAAADPGYGRRQFGDLIDALVAALSVHLSHKESDGLALVDAWLTEAEWKNFLAVRQEWIGEDQAIYLPWLLDQANAQTVAAVLGGFGPEELLTVYREKWGPNYAALSLWPD